MEKVLDRTESISEQVRDAMEKSRIGVIPRVTWEVHEALAELGEDFAREVI